MFVTDEVATALAACKGGYTQNPQAVQKAMEKCALCRSMFGPAWQSCARKIFVDKIKAGIADVERNDWDVDTSKLFCEMSQGLCQRLRDEGHKRGSKKWEFEVSLLGASVPFVVDFAGDQWMFEYWARLRTTAVNCGLLTPLPWEELLCNVGHMPDVPSQVRIDPRMVEEFQSCREIQAELLTPGMSLSMMISKLKAHYKELCDRHKSFKLDMALLETRAEIILREQVHDCHCKSMRNSLTLKASEASTQLTSS